ncbi:hypothetical protein Trydic_g15155 [Trypoxylus dichotomus]
MVQRREKKDETIGYNNLNQIIKIKDSKEADIKEKCTKIEILQAKHGNFNVHRKGKEITGTYRRRHLTELTSNDGNTVINTAELKDAWKTYIEQLFYDTKPEPPKLVNEMEPYIIVDEVTKAIKAMQEVKLPGPKFLKLLNDDTVR